MKILGLIPYWDKYDQKHFEVDRNKRLLAGSHPINFSLSAINKVDLIDEVYVFSSSENIISRVNAGIKCTHLSRPEYLDSDDVSIEDIINEFLILRPADILVLLHPNCPFLNHSTIQDRLDSVVSNKFDSAFSALKMQNFVWYQGKPLNYDNNGKTPSVESLSPVIAEKGSLYVFNVDMFNKTNKRIGVNPYVKCIGPFESHEIKTADDFEVAELMINSGMVEAH